MVGFVVRFPKPRVPTVTSTLRKRPQATRCQFQPHPRLLLAMVAEPVLLTSIKTLTLYAGEKTAARRTSPVPQLKCIGKPCNLYQPDAVQCFNVGGTGNEVNWKASLFSCSVLGMLIPLLVVSAKQVKSGPLSQRYTVAHILPTDLPSALRFGRVDVNCEGWSYPGDLYVLKGIASHPPWFNPCRLNPLPRRLLWSGIPLG